MDIVEIALVVGLGTIGLWVFYKVIANEEITTCVPGPFVIGGTFLILYLLVSYAE